MELAGVAVGVVSRWFAVLTASAAFVVVVPHAGAWAQSNDGGDVITLDDDAASDSKSDDDGGVDADGATKLKRLVIGSDQSAGDITNTPAAVSTISAEQFKERFANDTNAALRSTPGAYTREQAEQPGIIVNVRGMQGPGRVNMMIDGVPQTFRNLSGHGGTFDSMAYVDPNMLIGADITRGAVPGNEGLGTLSGSANLRTIDIDSVLLPGKTYGGLQTISLGTNGRYFSRLTAAGWRHPLDTTGEVSIMGAVSGSNFGNFKNGDGIEYPYDSSQQPKSGLFKFAFAPDDTQSLQLGGIWYDNAFAVESAGYDWAIKNKTYTAKYAYQPGDNLIDLKINAYANITDVQLTGQTADSVFNGRNGTDTGLGLDVSNTSTWDINDTTNIKFNYGAAINSDQYKGNKARGANPDGQLIKTGGYLDTTLTHGMFGLTTGLRYDAWSLTGAKDFVEPGTGLCPASHVGNCDQPSRDGGNWNPKIGATFTPQDWVQFYATYAYTMRPPSASEMFYPGGHNFDGSSQPIENNPDLVPERQKGLDVGVNLRGDGLLMPDDSAYAKIGYFRNRINNFITYATDTTTGDTKWVNLPGTTVMNGVEVEGGYDMGRAYANFSFTIANTDQPTPAGAGFGNDVGTLPDDFATLDVGTRFFDQKLTLGGRIRYTGDSIQVLMDKADQFTRPAYTLIDLYGSWKVSENFRTYFSVENVMNKSYWTSNSGTSDFFSGVTNGRGRTIIVGATAQF